MSIKDSPELQPHDGPRTRYEWEMSFVSNVTGAVDTLHIALYTQKSGDLIPSLALISPPATRPLLLYLL